MEGSVGGSLGSVEAIGDSVRDSDAPVDGSDSVEVVVSVTEVVLVIVVISCWLNRGCQGRSISRSGAIAGDWLWFSSQLERSSWRCYRTDRGYPELIVGAPTGS